MLAIKVDIETKHSYQGTMISSNLFEHSSFQYVKCLSMQKSCMATFAPCNSLGVRDHGCCYHCGERKVMEWTYTEFSFSVFPLPCDAVQILLEYSRQIEPL